MSFGEFLLIFALGLLTCVKMFILIFAATRSKPRFAAKALVAKYKGKAEVGEDMFPVSRLEIGNKSWVKRRRQGKMDAKEATPDEEDLENKEVVGIKTMVNEIKWWKDKADTLLMDRTEFEGDLKVAFDMLKGKKEEMEEVSRRHVKEMEILRDELVAEAVKSIFEAMIEMIREYQVGQHTTWNLEEEYAALRRIVREGTIEVNSKIRDMDKIEQVGETQEGGGVDKDKGVAFD